MVAIMVCQRANFTAGIVLLAAVAAPPAAFSQSRFGTDADREQEIAERVAQEEARSGSYSEGLIAPLSDLALLYQDRGDHDLAVAAITRVRQVVRANEGLHSLEQIPLIQQMIANEEAIGRADSAWELEQDLLTLARRHPSDIRTVPVFRETAAKRMALLRQYLAGEFPPQIVLGCYSGWPRRTVSREAIEGRPTIETRTSTPTTTGCNSGQKDGVIRAIVSDAQRNYADAIAVLLTNELYASDELRELELELVRTIEMVRAKDRYSLPACCTTPRLDLEPWRSWMDSMARLAEWELPQPVAEPEPEQSEPRDGEPISSRFYEGRCPDSCLGRQSLQRLLAYEIATSAPLKEQVEAFIRLADWGNDLEGYERALTMLQEAGAQTLIDEFFAPKTPVVLPTFLPNPLASDATQAAGYIDVAFEISRGQGRRVRILDTTTNATDADKTRLVQLIESSSFRPRVTDGEFARASPIVLRYYLP
jgi:hypothetical protein